MVNLVVVVSPSHQIREIRVRISHWQKFSSVPAGAAYISGHCWECVKAIRDKHGRQYEESGVELIVRELPVDYEFVKREVPLFWTQHKPKLVVHVGVHGLTDKILLENCAYNQGHSCRDITGLCPANGVCLEDFNQDCLQTQLDLMKVVEEMKQNCPVELDLSNDTGRFLCNFSYFCSLSINCGRSVFIHIPPADKPYSVSQLADGLNLVIRALLEQIDSVEERRLNYSDSTQSASVN